MPSVTPPQATSTTPVEHAIVPANGVTPPPIASLPPQLILHILSLLGSPSEISKNSLICKNFHSLVFGNPMQGLNSSFTNQFWRQLFEMRFPNKPQLSLDHNCLTAFKKQEVLDRNLTKGVYVTDILQGHGDRVNSVTVSEDKIISGSDDNTVRIWNLNTGELLHTLQGHGYFVNTVVVSEGRIISGSSDGTVRIWDLKTGALLHTLNGHTDSIRTVTVSEGKIISGSDDGMVRIWDLNTGELLHILQGHSNRVQSVVVSEGKIISGSFDRRVRIWDLNTGELLHVLQGHTGQVGPVTVSEGKIISGSEDRTVRIWDLNTGELLHTLQGHASGVSSVAVSESRIISGSEDGTVRIWDLNTGALLHTLEGHRDPVESVTVSEGKIISGSWDNKIRIWDFTAQDADVFQEIANELRSSNNQVVQNAMVRFSKMRARAKNQIYGHLYNILPKPIANDYFGVAEHMFHSQYGRSSTPVQRAQAIEAYLATLPVQQVAHEEVAIPSSVTIEELSEAFSYLQETLGIIDNQDKITFQNTEFSTAFLSKVGIITPGDLFTLGIDISALQEINALQQSLSGLLTGDNYQKFLADCKANRNNAYEQMLGISESLQSVIEKLNALKSAGENSAINTTEIESLIAQLEKADLELKSNKGSPASCNAYVKSGFQEFTQNMLLQCDQLSLTVKGAQSALLERYLTTPHLNSTWEQLRTQGFTNYADAVRQEAIGA